jgi:phosphopantothenoylcysteine decarboxylase/phosphopantothenate--cysteine ligase
MGGDSNSVHLVSASDVETWPTLSKTAVAKKLVERLGAMVGDETP